jgi:hypothetical protein
MARRPFYGECLMYDSPDDGEEVASAPGSQMGDLPKQAAPVPSSDRCPRCGTRFGYDGRFCTRCNYPGKEPDD